MKVYLQVSNFNALFFISYLLFDRITKVSKVAPNDARVLLLVFELKFNLKLFAVNIDLYI